ncbi:hypothetical protein OESDEN_19163 [Oesophagostomum dentatum]|uniref:Uncharacterized protein n=1 Tax=Oesophagostomum dentatum TaxID=61180 RepID=A0A0B1SBC1_OESDE|nr:hypothetical protein OESDEN_19163 [Oesophagostomum dentatum]
MTPQQLAAAGVWPPGIPMPPSIAQKQQQQKPPPAHADGENMGTDHDYRMAPSAQSSGDVDLRAAPPRGPPPSRAPPSGPPGLRPPDSRMGPPPDMRRPPIELNHAPVDQDQRIRNQEEEIRDPRRRPLPQVGFLEIFPIGRTSAIGFFIRLTEYLKTRGCIESLCT